MFMYKNFILFTKRRLNISILLTTFSKTITFLWKTVFKITLIYVEDATNIMGACTGNICSKMLVSKILA